VTLPASLRIPDWRARPDVLVVAIGLTAGVIATLRAATGHLIMPDRVPLGSGVFSELVHWGLWIAVSPAIGWTILRFPLGTRPLFRGLAGHIAVMLPLALLVGSLHALVRYDLMVLLDLSPAMALRTRWNPVVAVTGSVIQACWEYVVIVGLFSAFQYHEQARDRERRAAELERRLTTARLEILQSQLHPHFLFNVLHSTAVLTTTNGPAARDILVRLSDLLRRSLGTGHRLQVPLSEELDFLDRYLSIERIRFADRLRVQYDVDEDALGAMVPNLILQPLVENAVRHGVSRRSEAGQIAIRARRRAGGLDIEVEDDGPGLPPSRNGPAFGVGLSNVRARLHQSYAGDYGLDFERGPLGGLLIRLRIPQVMSLGASAQRLEPALP
jgi:signal transduction histidine kinase